MDALNTSTIVEVAGIADPSGLYMNSTISYILTLLSPYAQAIEPVTHYQQLVDWIPLAFQGELAVHLQDEMTNIINTQLTTGQVADAGTDQFVPQLKIAIVEYLAGEIITRTIDAVPEERHDIIIRSPWNVRKGIQSSPELSRLFGVDDTDQLPVTVVIGPQSFEHVLGQEFVVGLAVAKMVVKADYAMQMFGHALPEDDLRGLLNPYTDRYSVQVGDHICDFTDPSFLQGFNTGVMWAGGDPAQHLSNLQRDGEPVTAV